MTARITIWGASQLLNAYFTKRVIPPSSFFLALVQNTAPTPYMDGTEISEPTTPDYARVEILNDIAHWTNDAIPQEMHNVLEVRFATCTADWGRIGYWALCNANVGGNVLLVGDMTNPILASAGDQIVVYPSDLGLSVGPFYLAGDTSG